MLITDAPDTTTRAPAGNVEAILDGPTGARVRLG
ncbi:hypothetical protein JOF41_001339 [Saccharothrix coeruleofusca]|nr:hypothetical protein [Saccharothrix coeruleofusca]